VISVVILQQISKDAVIPATIFGLSSVILGIFHTLPLNPHIRTGSFILMRYAKYSFVAIIAMMLLSSESPTIDNYLIVCFSIILPYTAYSALDYVRGQDTDNRLLVFGVSSTLFILIPAIMIILVWQVNWGLISHILIIVLPISFIISNTVGKINYSTSEYVNYISHTITTSILLLVVGELIIAG
jgi:hypothetical protein